MFGGEKRRVFDASNALDCAQIFPDDSVPFFRKMLPVNKSCSRALTGLLPSWKLVASSALLSMSTCALRDDHTWNHLDSSAITTTMLHLCSAPCKALRFAPTARARGLRALTVPARR